MTNRINQFIWITLACLLTLPAFVHAEADRIGSVEYTRGAVSARDGDGAQRILGKDQPLFEKDVVTTGKDSFALIRLSDGSRITVRPDTVVGLQEYAYRKKKQSAIMRLFKGGLRALTGLIAKRNPDKGFQLRTATAVVGVRGTEFDARLCEGNCGDDKTVTKTSPTTPQTPVIGRVAQLNGNLSAISDEGDFRRVLSGGPVYQGDILQTGAGGTALIVFRDGSRMSLPPRSRMSVDRYEYTAKKKTGGAFFRLISGGVRMLSGIIAKRRPDAYRVSTPTAVVGLRGTAFDIRQCEGDCSEEAGSGKPLPAARAVRVKGEVRVVGRDGEKRVIRKGDSVYVGDILDTAAGGFTVLVFRDDSRATLQANTRFAVEDYHYDRNQDGSLIFRLYRGAMRAVSGWMAKRNPASFKIRTATAVVGVRGSAVDIQDLSGFTSDQLTAMGIDPGSPAARDGMVFFVRDGTADLTSIDGLESRGDAGPNQALFLPADAPQSTPVPSVPGFLADNPFAEPESVQVNIGEIFDPGLADPGRNLFVGVRDGAVSVTPFGGPAQVIGAGAAAMVSGWSPRVVLPPSPPPAVLNLPAPAPEEVPVDMNKLFGAVSQKKSEPGLYVSVDEGHVVMSNEKGDELHLGKGEAGYADPQIGELSRLESSPLFMINDIIPKPKEINRWREKVESRMDDSFGIPAAEELEEGDSGGDGPEDGESDEEGQEECECEIVY